MTTHYLFNAIALGHGNPLSDNTLRYPYSRLADNSDIFIHDALVLFPK